MVKAFNLKDITTSMYYIYSLFFFFQGKLCKYFDGVEMPSLHLMFLDSYAIL